MLKSLAIISLLTIGFGVINQLWRIYFGRSILNILRGGPYFDKDGYYRHPAGEKEAKEAERRDNEYHDALNSVDVLPGEEYDRGGKYDHF